MTLTANTLAAATASDGNITVTNNTGTLDVTGTVYTAGIGNIILSTPGSVVGRQPNWNWMEWVAVDGHRHDFHNRYGYHQQLPD